jgi:hypothetical protein
MDTLENIMEYNNHTFVDILKMDIEGSEFDIIESLNYHKVSFGQILIEFHERFFDNGKERLQRAIDALRNNGYDCFAISPNWEYSFINKRIYDERCGLQRMKNGA